MKNTNLFTKESHKFGHEKVPGMQMQLLRKDVEILLVVQNMAGYDSHEEC